MDKSKTVEEYFIKHSEWKEILTTLRKLLVSTPLTETIKWGAPIYTIEDKNVIGLGAFKNHVALWFFNGALLKDPHNMLINAQEGKTQAMRQLRFEKETHINIQYVSDYVNEAINNQHQGKTVKITKKPLVIPDELNELFTNEPSLKHAYNQLSLSKQREFAEHISSAKQKKTKQSRLSKIIPMIRERIGLHDKYKNC